MTHKTCKIPCKKACNKSCNKSCKKALKSRRLKTRKQQIYNMKGCSKKKTCVHRCHKCNHKCCNKCGNKYGHRCHKCGNKCGCSHKGKNCRQKGGLPGPLIGSPIGTSYNTWPGVDGIAGNRNYYANNLYNAGDPQTNMKLGGTKIGGTKIGGTKIGGTKKNNKKKGGGLVPHAVTNIARDFGYNLKSGYNALNGLKAPVNPLPYNDQFPNSKNVIF